MTTAAKGRQPKVKLSAALCRPATYCGRCCGHRKIWCPDCCGFKGCEDCFWTFRVRCPECAGGTKDPIRW
ncbi:hypothetical protein [Streptomyces microflavus]|uniref:hypothetical protein n=1 Tax=Streptomyces microflavus TaxID=1919 RepID=UPI00364D98E3